MLRRLWYLIVGPAYVVEAEIIMPPGVTADDIREQPDHWWLDIETEGAADGSQRIIRQVFRRKGAE